MSHKRNVRERQHEEVKRARLPGIIAFLLAILSFSAFIYLDRKLAPPYSFLQSPTNSVSQATNSAPTSPR